MLLTIEKKAKFGSERVTNVQRNKVYDNAFKS